MIFYFLLILVGVIITFLAIYNLYTASKIKKKFENYLFIITSKKGYLIGATLFSLALLLVISYQVIDYIFDIRIFAILFFFLSLFLLSLSHLIYYLVAEKKLSDYKEFFKEFEIDLNNNCQKIMLKHIFDKTKDEKKTKEIFKINKNLCKE